MSTVKSFTSREDAQAFSDGKKVESSIKGPEKFYAVAVGSPPGIYTTWDEAKLALPGVKGPKYKKFGTRAEAVEYIKQFGNKEAIEALGEEAGVVDVLEVFEQPAKKAKTTHAVPEPVPTGDELWIYTDGSSLSNGKAGSRAGLGVYFGEGDPRNLSERLVGEPQTNQRAELTAMLRALQTVQITQNVRIFTDSQYSINCVTQWAYGWRRKDWKTATGGEVKNQDIIRKILDKMEERTAAGAKTEYQWVKGHATNKGNVKADILAVQGAKK